MGELAQGLLLIAALLGIYAFMFRGIFGKTRGPSLFGSTSSRPSDPPAWGTALLGGFAAGQIATIVDVPASAVITIAVVAGLSAALGKNWNWASWPAAAIGLGATAVSVITFVPRTPGAATWAVLFYVVLAVAVGDTMRVGLRWRRGSSAADKAMAYFAASEAATFLVAPGGEPVLDSLDGMVPVGAIVLVLAITLAPFVLGLLDGPFLTMFSTAIALAGLYLDFTGVGELGFLASMGLIASAMATYWVVRWVVRGFSGVGLLSD